MANNTEQVNTNVSPAEKAVTQENLSATIAANMTDVPETLEMPVKETAQQKEEKIADTRSWVGKLFNAKTAEQKAALKAEKEKAADEKILKKGLYSIFGDETLRKQHEELKRAAKEDPKNEKKTEMAKKFFSDNQADLGNAAQRQKYQEIFENEGKEVADDFAYASGKFHAVTRNKETGKYVDASTYDTKDKGGTTGA